MIDLIFSNWYFQVSATQSNRKTQMLTGGEWRGQQYSVTSSVLGLN